MKKASSKGRGRMTKMSKIKKTPANLDWVGKVPISRKYRVDVLRRTKGREKLTREHAEMAVKKNKKRFPQFEFVVEEIK